MSLTAIPRAVLDRSIRLARFPADSALKLAGNSSAAGMAKLGLDRVEAAVRAGAGTVLRDEGLVHEARRQDTATAERKRAAELRAQAEQKEQEARQQAQAREQEAAERRQQAAQAAEKRKRSADQKRKAAKSQAAESAQARKENAEKAAAAEKEAAQESARRDQLDHLETKREALEEREGALTASQEAQRLADAASRAKADRKT
jgi:colicin import membrane protein